MPFLEVAGGALIGGGVSLGTTLLVETRKVKADLQKEDRLHQRELLQILRLMEAECRFNLSTLSLIQERDEGPWFPPTLPIKTSAWKTHKGVLALHPDQDLWHKVDLFYTVMLASENVKQDEGNTDAARKNLDQSCERARQAMTALQKAVQQVTSK